MLWRGKENDKEEVENKEGDEGEDIRWRNNRRIRRKDEGKGKRCR